ncbi:MAG TPA: glucosaminidase domain-containing protein [Burkholderiaceae bacterium]|jgi:flagellum-specific peptidoglycan hydrolase FlgJ|nr:glucosaminidase domain-containing protein [Burkholderiaceae bacterium]
MTPTEFIALLAPPAQATQAATGIPASFTIAQGAVESAWYSSGQAVQDFNLFGIKADASWRGVTQIWPTREVVDGHSVMVNARFRKYADLAAGLQDHATFLTGNPRYAPAFQHRDDSCAFAQAVAAAGYASDPHYADSIVAIINGHNLKQYDRNNHTKEAT